jgi:hypothetical protein
VPGLSLNTAALVLERHPAAADGWVGFQLFASETGLLSAMRRERKAGPAEPPPDLFDEIDARLESSNQGRTWFFTEVRIRRRPTGIGRSYETLRCASSLARIVLRNPIGPDSRPAVYGLLTEAFDAFALGLRADVVLFKALFRFARSEGYPVKQEWLAELPGDDAAAAEDILARPVRDVSIDPERVSRWQLRLEDYLRNRAELDIE